MLTPGFRRPALFVVLTAIVSAACGGSPSSPTPSPTPTPTQTPTAPADCGFSVGDGPAGDIAAAGGQFDVTVTTAAGCAWSASSTAQFIATVGAASGTGTGSVRFSVAANTGAARQGTVQVANRTLTVNQAASGSACEFTVDPMQASVDGAGGTVSVTVTRTLGICGWTATSNDAFITIDSGASGSSNGTTVLRVAASNVGAPRTGTVNIAGRVVTITQGAGQECAFGVSPTTISMPAPGGTAQLSVTVTAGSINCRWTAQSNSNFLSINATSAVGPGNPTVTVAANTGAARSGTLTVGGQTVTVNQSGTGVSTGAVAILSYQSDPGDYIGQGLSDAFTLTGSQFAVTLNGAQTDLTFRMPGSPFWQLMLRSNGGVLAPGTYNQAARASFAPAGTPGLDFFGSGRGCNQVTGRFLVQTAIFSGTDVQRLHVRFEQYCEGWSTPLRGQLWVDAAGAQPPALANFPVPPASPVTLVTYTSDAGDPIGKGQSGSFTLSGFKFNAWAHSNLPAVNISMQTAGNIPTTFWHFDFSATSGTRLQPGTYTGALRYPFNSAAPGLSIGNGSGCNTLTGSFVVLEAVYGPQGEVLRFHATFEQHCEGAVPALRGEIWIAADPWR